MTKEIYKDHAFLEASPLSFPDNFKIKGLDEQKDKNTIKLIKFLTLFPQGSPVVFENEDAFRDFFPSNKPGYMRQVVENARKALDRDGVKSQYQIYEINMHGVYVFDKRFKENEQRVLTGTEQKLSEFHPQVHPLLKRCLTVEQTNVHNSEYSLKVLFTPNELELVYALALKYDTPVSYISLIGSIWGQEFKEKMQLNYKRYLKQLNTLRKIKSDVKKKMNEEIPGFMIGKNQEYAYQLKSTGPEKTNKK